MAKIYYNDNGTWKVVDIAGGGSGGGGSIDPTSTVTAYGFHATGAEGQMYIYPDNIQYWDTAGNQHFYFFPTKSGVYSYTLLTERTVKTLFGNQSIVGSGNIDLYRHIVELIINIGNGVTAYAVIISSKNLVIDSLADLKTVLGNTFNYPIQGFGQSDSSEGIIAYLMTDRSVYCNTSYTAIPISWANVTISDTVTTI